MKLHYKGKFDGNEESLPHGEHRENAVRFREPEAKKFTLMANAGTVLFACTRVFFGRNHSAPLGRVSALFCNALAA